MQKSLSDSVSLCMYRCRSAITLRFLRLKKKRKEIHTPIRFRRRGTLLVVISRSRQIEGAREGEGSASHGVVEFHGVHGGAGAAAPAAVVLPSWPRPGR